MSCLWNFSFKKIHENLVYHLKRKKQHLFIAKYKSTGSRFPDLRYCCKVMALYQQGIFGSLAALLWCDMTIFGNYIQLLLKGRSMGLEEGRRRGWGEWCLMTAPAWSLTHSTMARIAEFRPGQQEAAAASRPAPGVAQTW